MGMAKKLTCGMLAAFMVVAAAAPAEARHWRHWDRDKDVDAGDVIGAAVLIGGIAALAGAFKEDRYGGRYGAERKAIRACVREAEGSGSSVARVREIEDVEQRDGYFFVRGTFETGSYYRDSDEPEVEGFSCTARGKTIYDFQRSSGHHW